MRRNYFYSNWKNKNFNSITVNSQSFPYSKSIILYLLENFRMRLFLYFITTLNICIIFAQEQKPKTSKSKFTLLPYINYSDSQKLMYGAIGLFTFQTDKKDTISPTSTAGASYIRTGRGSYFTNVFTKLYLKEDQWRIAAMAGIGTYEFQTFLDNGFEDPGFYNYASDNQIITVRLLRKVHKKSYIGMGYFYNSVTTNFEDFPVTSSIKSSAVQGIYLNDSRDDQFYPTKGIKTGIIYSFYPSSFGNQENYGILNAYFNTYFHFRERDVLALRAMTKLGTQKLQFQRQVVLSGTDLRGYTNGKYRGNGKADLQAEYRYQLSPRIGFVGFGGIATLFGSDIESFNQKIYPSVGTGIRFEAVKSTGMRFGMDVARGKEEWAIYFRLGETF